MNSDSGRPHRSARPGRLDTAQGGTLLLRYTDPVEGSPGYLAIDGHDNPLAAGGFRVQPGLTADRVVALAQTMTRKQRLLGLAVDGAKCGIDYHPARRGKHAAMRRFLRFLQPYLNERFSMGPDAGTSWDELEHLAAQEGLHSVKLAAGRAQGLSQRDTLARLRLLDRDADGLTLAQRRAGHGLAHAALAALQWAEARGTGSARVGLQGFGTLGKAAAVSLARAGLRVTAVADEHRCVTAPGGLDVATLAASTDAADLVGGGADEPAALFSAPVELLVLAACEDALTAGQAADLPASLRVVAVGANLGLNAAAEEALHERGVVVVPDFVGGSGGSASMNALFAPPRCPAPERFLEQTGAVLRDTVRSMLTITARRGVTPRAAALELAEERRPPTRARPYTLADPARVEQAT